MSLDKVIVVLLVMHIINVIISLFLYKHYNMLQGDQLLKSM